VGHIFSCEWITLNIHRSSARCTEMFISGQCRLLLESMLVNLISALRQAAQEGTPIWVTMMEPPLSFVSNTSNVF
jgi:hypothetical protein